MFMKFWSVENIAAMGVGVVGGDFLHSMDLKEFFKILLLRTADQNLE